VFIDGGGDTIAATMRSILLLLVAYPDAQEALRREVDSTFGDRIPDLSEAESMPYLQAFLQEVSLAHQKHFTLGLLLLDTTIPSRPANRRSSCYQPRPAGERFCGCFF
jgi:hypothetical protein